MTHSVAYDEAMKRLVPYVVLALFVALTAVGLAFDEFRLVLANAITICLSCIGIG
jgi:hypothetical protein